MDLLAEHSDLLGILLDCFGTVLVGVLSYLAAVRKCRGEIHTLKLQWQHEREQSADAEFSALLRDVIEYCHSDLGYSDQLLPSVMAFRAKAADKMDETLSALYAAILRDDRIGAEALAAELVRLSRADRRKA